MSNLPSASTRLAAQSASAPIATDLIAVFACAPMNADSVPRLFSNLTALLGECGYSRGAEYAALHIQGTGKALLYVPLPIAVAGTIGRFNASGNTGTSVVTASAAGGGIMEETDGAVSVLAGGTVGTDQIILGVSLGTDAPTKPLRIGTGNSATLPYVGIALSLGAGTLNEGDVVLTWHTTAPKPDFTALGPAYAAMKAQKRGVRSWLFADDVGSLADAQAVQAKVNEYETDAERYVYAKIQVRDRLPVAALSQVRSRMTPATLTFAEVGASGDTITRAANSFVSDGFVAGDTIRVTGSSSNNVTGVVASLTDLVLTMGTTDLAAEGPVANVSITSEPTLIFAGTGHTITRNRGSWFADGFRVGDSVTIAGTASNNSTHTITALTATVMTFAAGLADETVGSFGISVTTGETDSAWMASIVATFETVTSDRRMDIGAGRLTKASPITGYTMRRGVQWADSIRSYQHDVRTPTWRKIDGPLIGWGIDGEHDEYANEGLVDDRFTCARTWGNGPVGAFIAESRTRADDGDPLGLTHNAAVANLTQSIVQRETENFVGLVEQLNLPDADGKRTLKSSALALLESMVNAALRRELLGDPGLGGEGPRASSAVWTAATDDDFSGDNPTLHGTCALVLNGTIVHVVTVVEV